MALWTLNLPAIPNVLASLAQVEAKLVFRRARRPARIGARCMVASLGSTISWQRGQELLCKLRFGRLWPVILLGHLASPIIKDYGDVNLRRKLRHSA
jgi:hypothetical protein